MCVCLPSAAVVISQWLTHLLALASAVVCSCGPNILAEYWTNVQTVYSHTLPRRMHQHTCTRCSVGNRRTMLVLLCQCVSLQLYTCASTMCSSFQARFAWARHVRCAMVYNKWVPSLHSAHRTRTHEHTQPLSGTAGFPLEYPPTHVQTFSNILCACCAGVWVCVCVRSVSKWRRKSHNKHRFQCIAFAVVSCVYKHKCFIHSTNIFTYRIWYICRWNQNDKFGQKLHEFTGEQKHAQILKRRNNQCAYVTW